MASLLLKKYDDITDNFVFSYDLPLSSWPVVTGTLIGYLVVMYGGNAILGVVPGEKRPKNAYHTFLKWFNAVHNFVMWAISLICFLGSLHSAFDIAFFRAARYSNVSGFYGVICDPAHKHAEGKLAFWNYIYFLSKYVELIDTLLIVLRQSRLRFLHTYHHVFTMFIAFYGLFSKTTGQWVIIGINALVHVVMYYYYVLATFGIDVWWKNYLTDFQLSQFVADLALIAYFLYAHNFVEIPKGGACTGSNVGAMVAGFMLLSYFVLFLQLRLQNSRRPARPAKGEKPKSE